MSFNFQLPNTNVHLEAQVEHTGVEYRGSETFGAFVDARRSVTLAQVQAALYDEDFRRLLDDNGYIRFLNIDPEGSDTFFPIGVQGARANVLPHSDGVPGVLYCSDRRGSSTLFGPREGMIDLITAFYRDHFSDIFNEEILEILRVARRLFLYGADNGKNPKGGRIDTIATKLAHFSLFHFRGSPRSYDPAFTESVIALQEILIKAGAVFPVSWNNPHQAVAFSRLPLHLRECKVPEAIDTTNNLLIAFY